MSKLTERQKYKLLKLCGKWVNEDLSPKVLYWEIKNFIAEHNKANEAEIRGLYKSLGHLTDAVSDYNKMEISMTAVNQQLRDALESCKTGIKYGVCSDFQRDALVKKAESALTWENQNDPQH